MPWAARAPSSDREKEDNFLRTRLHDLAPDVRDAIVGAWAQNIQREIGDRLVAELDEEVRRGVRSYLDASGYFVSPALMQEAEELGAGRACAARTGRRWPGAAASKPWSAPGAPISELPADLRAGVLALSAQERALPGRGATGRVPRRTAWPACRLDPRGRLARAVEADRATAQRRPVDQPDGHPALGGRAAGGGRRRAGRLQAHAGHREARR